MSLLSLFAAQRGAFETAYLRGDCGPLGAFYADDVTYEVMNMPFHCVLRGREAVLAGFRPLRGTPRQALHPNVGIDASSREGSGALAQERPRPLRLIIPDPRLPGWQHNERPTGRSREESKCPTQPTP